MRKHKGFTMIEMLVIVGCIAALVAIAYPKFSDMMEKNRENTDIVAMQSAHALLETAFDTGLLIDGRPITDATPAAPLYYDPSGKLTWQKPEGYGEGTDNPSGVTWSCCDDYEYNPAASYKGDFIYCYYVAPGESVTHSGLHVHWFSDGDSGNVPAPNPPVPTVTFPTVPKQSEETTEPTGGNTPAEPPKEEDKPGGSDNFEDPIFKNLKSHEFPYTDEDWNTSGFRLKLSHVYRYTDPEGKEHVYVSLCDDPGNNTYRPDQTPLPGGTYAHNVAEPNGIVLTKNGDEDGNFKFEPGKTMLEYGTIYRDENDNYYIFKAGPTVGVYPNGSGNDNWVPISLGCPDKCGADIDH